MEMTSRNPEQLDLKTNTPTHTEYIQEVELKLRAYPLIITNGSTLMEEEFLKHAVQDMSKGKERKIHIINCHLPMKLQEKSQGDMHTKHQKSEPPSPHTHKKKEEKKK